MPVFFLFIATLVVFAVLFPGRAIYFLLTIIKWIQYRRTYRESLLARQDETDAAFEEWRSLLEHELRREKKLRTDDEKFSCYYRMLAAGQRYLKSVSPDEVPVGYYEKVEIYCRSVEDVLTSYEKNKGKMIAQK